MTNLPKEVFIKSSRQILLEACEEFCPLSQYGNPRRVEYENAAGHKLVSSAALYWFNRNLLARHTT